MKLDIDKIKAVLEEVIENYGDIRNDDIDCFTLQPVRNLLVDIKKYENEDFKSKLGSTLNEHGSLFVMVGGSSGSGRALKDLKVKDLKVIASSSIVLGPENIKALRERGLLLANERNEVVEEIDRITELFYGPNIPIPEEIIEGKVFSSVYNRDSNIKGQGPKWMKKKQSRDFR